MFQALTIENVDNNVKGEFEFVSAHWRTLRLCVFYSFVIAVRELMICKFLANSIIYKANRDWDLDSLATFEELFELFFSFFSASAWSFVHVAPSAFAKWSSTENENVI